MASLTRYFPGGAATEVSATPVPIPGLSAPSFVPPSVGGVPGMPDLSGVLAQRAAMEAARERRAQQLHRLQLAAMRQDMGARRDAMPSQLDRQMASRDAQSESRFRGNVQDLQLQAMAADEQAQSAPPPLRRIGEGPNQVSGWGLDTNAMNARQRRVFLPDRAGAVNDPSTSTMTGLSSPVDELIAKNKAAVASSGRR